MTAPWAIVVSSDTKRVNETLGAMGVLRILRQRDLAESGIRKLVHDSTARMALSLASAAFQKHQPGKIPKGSSTMGPRGYEFA